MSECKVCGPMFIGICPHKPPSGPPRDSAWSYVELATAYDRLERELSEAEEIIDVWKSRSEINGKLAMKLQDERDALAAKLKVAREALERIEKAPSLHGASWNIAVEALAEIKE